MGKGIRNHVPVAVLEENTRTVTLYIIFLEKPEEKKKHIFVFCTAPLCKFHHSQVGFGTQKLSTQTFSPKLVWKLFEKLNAGVLQLTKIQSAHA